MRLLGVTDGDDQVSNTGHQVGKRVKLRLTTQRKNAQ